MITFIRSHSGIIIALGTGIVIGTGATLLLHKLTSQNVNTELAYLAATLDALKQEVSELKSLVQQQLASVKRKRPRSGYFSAPSSGDEEEEFQEAYGGSDSELTLEAKSTTSDDYFTATSGASNGSLVSGDPVQLYGRVDKLLEGTDSDKEEAFKLLVEKERQLSNCVDFLWRFARATYVQSGIEGNRGKEDRKKELVYASKDHAFKALELDGSSPDVQKWCAITIGSIGDYESTQAKILNGFKFKEHIEKAIQLCPTDSSAHYLLGRWCYGVYMLSWVERQVAATLFASPPSATVDQALDCFMKAEQLNPGLWKDNCLYVAKCHIEKRDYYVAVEWLDKADRLPSVSADDKVSQTEVVTLLNKYNWYRR